MERVVDPLGLRKWSEQQRKQRELLEDPFGIRAQRRMFQQMIRPAALEQFARQQRLLDDLTKGPAILGTLGSYSGTLPSTIAEQADQFRDELASTAEVEEVDEETDPLPRLANEREAILICLARVRDSAIVAGLTNVPIPDVILALIVAAVVIGEVADEILTEREAEVIA